MHHVERHAFDVLGEADHAPEREVLRQGVVHLGHVLEGGAVLAEQLLVHVPDDVVVQRQVLAEPDGLLAERTWASLADGDDDAVENLPEGINCTVTETVPAFGGVAVVRLVAWTVVVPDPALSL